MTYRILVATDLSDASAHAMRHALGILARIPGSELHVGHVVVDKSTRRHFAEDERLLGEAMVGLRASVGATLAAADQGGERVERAVMHHVRLARSPARAIEQLALDVSADLVVVGSHARRGLERLVLGSVARDLLENGRVALLVARPNVFDGMTATAKPDAATPGADLHHARQDLVVSTERISWRVPAPHVAGLV